MTWTYASLMDRRRLLLLAGLVTVVVVVVLTAGWVTIASSMTAGDLLVGVGTLALAAFTYRLGSAALAESARVGDQVAIERERLDGEAQPWVVPAPDPSWSWRSGEGRYAGDDWKRLLPVKNVGPGAALNVKGSLNWPPPSGTVVDVMPTSLGPGEREDLRVNWVPSPKDDWSRVEGTLNYSDVNKRLWQTRFVIEQRNEVRTVEVSEILDVSKPWRGVAGEDATTTVADNRQSNWPASSDLL
jgi:hypothetical protein